MSSTWDDFDDNVKLSTKSRMQDKREKHQELTGRDRPIAGCDWGQSSCADGGADTDNLEASQGQTDSSKFIRLYERYLQDKKSILQQTSNYKTYVNNPQKELRDWFENLEDSELEFKPRVEQISGPAEQFVCTLDLPVEEHDFCLTSSEHKRRKEAIDEVCLDACRLLDDCGLLYAWQAGREEDEEPEQERRKRVNEALKEDDIVFDNTRTGQKKQCTTTATGAGAHSRAALGASGVNTYESLMARWRELNMSILLLKAKLVKLDLSVTNTKQARPSRPALASDKSARSSSASTGDAGKPLGTGGANDADACTDGGDVQEKDEEEGDEEDEADPLDEFMSTLETKTKLSMDDKIEKSRIKSQIASYEREQNECARLIEIAKPGTGTARGKT